MPKKQQQPPPPITTHTSTSSSSSVAAPTLQSLPDALLVIVLKHLKPSDLILGLQLVNRWALSFVAESIEKLVLWSKPMVEVDPPPSAFTEAYDAWVLKYAPSLCSFMSRFPNIIILQADPTDHYLVSFLKEVFERQTFPTIERFQHLRKYCTNCNLVFQLPLRPLMAGLPGLVAVHVGGLSTYKMEADFFVFLKGLADGILFPRLQELSLQGINISGSRLVKGLIEAVTDALRAREAVGTCPPLTSLHVYSDTIRQEHTQALQELLSLQSCSKLRSLTINVLPSREESLEIQASYLRRTECASLESLGFVGNGQNTDSFGPLTAVLMSGMAFNLTKFSASHFLNVDLAQLSAIIESGALPSLKELHLDCYVTEGTCALLTNGVLNPLLTSFSFGNGLLHLSSYANRVAEETAFFQALLNGAFPKLKMLYMCGMGFKSPSTTFLSILQQAGANTGAKSLREVWFLVDRDVHSEDFKTLLPAATVRIVPSI